MAGGWGVQFIVKIISRKAKLVLMHRLLLSNQTKMLQAADALQIQTTQYLNTYKAQLGS